jgi:thioredoxin reductase (NADPH)
MVNEAEKCGVHMELGEVVEIESYSGCKSVHCADGRAYTSTVVIVAGGLSARKLGVPGEERFQGKGVIHCTLCDAGLYAGQAVAVCGGGYAGIIEALYLANHASKVYLIEAQPELSAPAPLQERARANASLEIRCAAKVVEILGHEFVTGVQVQHAATGAKELLAVSGVLARVGLDPATGYLEGLLSLDERGGIEANDRFETDVSGILAAGDIRSESPRRVWAAVSDGKTAAMSAQRLLQTAAKQA